MRSAWLAVCLVACLVVLIVVVGYRHIPKTPMIPAATTRSVVAATGDSRAVDKPSALASAAEPGDGNAPSVTRLHESLELSVLEPQCVFVRGRLVEVGGTGISGARVLLQTHEVSEGGDDDDDINIYSFGDYYAEPGPEPISNPVLLSETTSGHGGRFETPAVVIPGTFIVRVFHESFMDWASEPLKPDAAAINLGDIVPRCGCSCFRPRSRSTGRAHAGHACLPMHIRQQSRQAAVGCYLGAH